MARKNYREKENTNSNAQTKKAGKSTSGNRRDRTVEHGRSGKRYSVDTNTKLCDTRKDARSYDDIHTNDISWYNKASYLFDEATRVPFSVIEGAPISYNDSVRTSDVAGSNKAIATPGIMMINFYPYLGTSKDDNSPVNRAFTSMYGDIASKTTGAMQFQQASLAMFVCSFASAACFIGHAKRLLEIATLWAPTNYYYPIDLLTMLTGSEANARDIIKNRDIYRAQLNNLIYQFNVKRIPDFVDIFKRQYSLSHSLFLDSDDVQGQIYMFRPNGLYIYNDKSTTMEFTSPTEWSWQYVTDLIQDALYAWQSSSDLPLIVGALQRAYTDSQFISLDVVTPESQLIPTVDRNIMWQINNSVSCAIDPASLNVTQDVASNLIFTVPKVNYQSMYGTEGTIKMAWRYFNSYDYNESPEFIMEASRLIPFVTLTPNSGTTFAQMTSSPTEIVNSYAIGYRCTPTGQTASKLMVVGFTTNVAVSATSDPKSSTYFTRGLEIMQLVSKFKNGPRLNLYMLDNTTWKYLGDVGMLDHYTTINQDQLEELHEAAIQSLYWVGDFPMKI